MTDEKSLVKELFSTVGTLRDEARVQANLAKKDAKDELHRLEEKWEAVGREHHRVREVVEETAAETWSGLRLVLEELHEGYRKIRESK